DSGAVGQGEDPFRPVNHAREPLRVGSDTDWARVVAGTSRTCALRADRSLWCWGSNLDGELGFEEGREIVWSPERLGAEFWASMTVGGGSPCGIRPDHSLWCWGWPASSPLAPTTHMRIECPSVPS